MAPDGTNPRDNDYVLVLRASMHIRFYYSVRHMGSRVIPQHGFEKTVHIVLDITMNSNSKFDKYKCILFYKIYQN